MIGTIITPAGTRTYVVEDVPEYMPEYAPEPGTTPAPAAARAGQRPRRLRGMLLTLGAIILLLALLGLSWIGTALALRPARVPMNVDGPTTALLALGPAELLGATPVLVATARTGAPQP